jgi:hypothetical protein
MKTIFVPHLNRNVHLGGRQPRKPGGLRLHFSDFIDHAALAPQIPAAADFFPKGGTAISDVLGNDAEGDCIYAGGYHVVAVETGNATGTPFHATLAQVNHDYSAVTGFVPGVPSTDNGGQMTDALDYWKKNGFANGTKLLGYLSVNPKDPVALRAACFLGENLYLGGGLPDSYVAPFPSGNGFTWGAGTPNPNNGHCIMSAKFGPDGLGIDTWGMTGTLTYEGVAEVFDEVYVLITPDQLAKGQTKAPNGVAWNDILQAFGLPVPVPAPTPAPAPAPVPPGQVQMTLPLAIAQLFAIDKLNAAPCGAFAKADAIKLVGDSLAMHWAKK